MKNLVVNLTFRPMKNIPKSFKDGRDILCLDHDGDIYQLHFDKSFGKFMSHDSRYKHSFYENELVGYAKKPATKQWVKSGEKN